MTIFETERLRVRHFTQDDYDHFFSLQGDAEVMRYIRPPRTREESDGFLRDNLLAADPNDYKGYWAVEDRYSGAFVGSFVIIPIPNEPEKIQMGYSLLQAHWGKGYASELALEGASYFRHRTPLDILYGVTETPNIASQRVLLKAGFSFLETKQEGEKELQVYVLRR